MNATGHFRVRSFTGKEAVSELAIVQGAFAFVTYVAGQSATGTYDVSFADGTAEQGSFTVSAACNTVTCGGGWASRERGVNREPRREREPS